MNTQTLLNRLVPGQDAADAESRTVKRLNRFRKRTRLQYTCTTDGATGAELEVYGRASSEAPWVLLTTIAQGDLDSEDNYVFDFIGMPELKVKSVVNDATTYAQDVVLHGDYAMPVSNIGGVLERVILVKSDGLRAPVSVYLPDDFDPGKKYPTWIFAAGSGSDRRILTSKATTAAAQGFIGVTTDARGTGESINLNDTSLYGNLYSEHIRNIFDVMEIPELLRDMFIARTPNADDHSPIDFERLFFSGGSNGGVQSYLAAAYSGVVPNTMTGYAAHASGWRDGTLAFPKFKAVVPGRIAPQAQNRMVDQGGITSNGLTNALRAMNNDLARWDPEASSSQGLHYLPASSAEIRGYLSTNDAAGLYSLLTADTRFQDVADPAVFVPRLNATETHILGHAGYDDFWGHSEDIIAAQKSNTSGKMYISNLSTIGHKSPDNDAEEDLQDGQLLAFMVAHAFGDESLLSTYFDEATLANLDHCRMGIAPGTDLGYQGDTIWEEVWVADVATMDAIPLTRLYCRPSGALGTGAPGTGGSQAVTLVENVATDWSDLYDAVNDSDADPVATLFGGGSPLYTSTAAEWALTVTADYRLVSNGSRGTARLFIGAIDTEFDVGVSLWKGSTRFAVLGYKRVTGHPTGTIQQYDIPFLPYGFDWDNGDELRLKVEAVAFQQPPYDGEDGVFKILPKLQDAAFNVYWGSGTQSYIDLPLIAGGTTNI